MANSIYILQHSEIQIDGYRIFKTEEQALDCLKDWYEIVEDDLSSFSLARFELDEETGEYVHKEEIDLSEYFSESEEEDVESVSVISSGSDTESSEEEQK